MLTRSRNFLGALVIGAAVALTPMMGDSVSTVSAQPRQQGLVNVAIGDVTILQNVGIGVAANVAANVCGVAVGPVAALAANVAQSQTTQTVCMTGPQTARVPVTISP
jgi:hypothetical protein